MITVGKPRTALKLAAIAGTAAVLLAACSQGDPGTPSGDGATTFSFLSAVESPSARDELTTLSENECSAENEALPLETPTVPQADITTRTTLLASQNALPVMFPASSESVNPDGDLVTGGLVVDYEKTLNDLGITDNLLPGAVSAIKKAYNGRLATLPLSYNIEGIFYNKQIFADQGIEVPTTYEDLMAAADKLQAAGIQPFTVAGKDGWPATRWLSTYLFRDLGPDALDLVASGDAKLTDPEYLGTAEALANMGAKGYFGQGVSSIDYDTANNTFVTGGAAMMYGLTSLLAVFNDPEQNPLGAENIGLMSFPTVEGGKGTIDQFPANAGTPVAMSSALYGPKVGDWLTCIAENYGSGVLASQGAISGFALNTPVDDVAPLTSEVQDLMETSTEGLLWFEAKFDEKSRDTAKFNVAKLISGDMSPADYMASVQQSLDAAQ